MKPAEHEWTELGERMFHCVTCHMAWAKGCYVACKCAGHNFGFNKLRKNYEPEMPDKPKMPEKPNMPEMKMTVITGAEIRAAKSVDELLASKFEIELNCKSKSNVIKVTVTTRASFINPKQFKPIVMEFPPTTTMEGVRTSIALKCHDQLNVDVGPFMRCTLKTEQSQCITKDISGLEFGTTMKMYGMHGNLKLNMCCDGYGAGGGKRAMASIASKNNWVIVD